MRKRVSGLMNGGQRVMSIRTGEGSLRFDGSSLISMRGKIFLTTIVLIAATQCIYADSPSVTAVLSNSEGEVGETVDLEIRVTGGRNADVPQEIAVDGLEIQRTGTSQRFEMNNFNVTSSVTYNYP